MILTDLLKKKKIAAVVLLQILFSFYLYAEHDQAIGEIYFKNAYKNYLQQEYKFSKRLIETSLEFYPDNSDALYLKTFLIDDKAENLSDIRFLLKTALDYGNWNLLKKHDCLQDISEILFKTKKYDKAIFYLDKMIKDGVNREDSLLLYGKCLFYLNRKKEAAGILISAVKLYPEDYRFYNLLVKVDNDFRQAVTEKYLATDNVSDLPLDLLLEIIGETKDQALKEKLLKIYFSMGGSSIKANIEKLKYKKEIFKSDITDIIKKGLFQNKENTIKMFSIIYRKENMDYLLRESKNYTGETVSDRNNDDYFEVISIYTKGTLTQVIIDNDQDNKNEYKILLNNEKATKAFIQNGNSVIAINYGDYPIVSSVSVDDESGQKEYTLISGELVYPIIKIPENIFSHIEFSNISTFNKNELDRISIRIKEYKNGTGWPVNSLEKDIDSNIVIKKGLKKDGSFRSILFFKDNDPNYNLTDVNEDGIFELKENYKDNKLVSIAYDANNNGTPEFYLTFGKENYKLWDLNEDSIIDCREWEKDSSVFREYSTSMDGQFDTFLEIKKGNIIQFVKNGITLSIYEDPESELIWIGEKPDTEIRISPEIKGKYIKEGKEYYIFSLSGKRYIEVLN